MAKDIIHDAVMNALIKDGWTITDDPLVIRYRDAHVLVDLGAERVIAAERGNQKIAVEIKSFIGRSLMRDMEVALGQYILYLSFLQKIEPERKLYLAVSHLTYDTVMQGEAIQMLIEVNHMPLLVVQTDNEEVLKWIPK
jgi:hypothetical protein